MGDKEEFEKLSSFIGRYILFFQYVESKIDQMLLLATDLNRWHVGQTLLTRLGYRQKVDVLSAIVHGSQIAYGTATQQEWIPKFDSIVIRLQAEGARRNDIVHSLHLFDFVKIGAPVVRSRRSANKKGFKIENVAVDEAESGRILTELVDLYMDANFAHVQLVAWYNDLGLQCGGSPGLEPNPDEPGHSGC